MNVENIWQTLVFAVAIFGAYAIFALGWPAGRVSGIGLAVVLAPPALLAGAYGLIMLFASDEAEIYFPQCACGASGYSYHQISEAGEVRNEDPLAGMTTEPALYVCSLCERRYWHIPRERFELVSAGEKHPYMEASRTGRWKGVDGEAAA